MELKALHLKITIYKRYIHTDKIKYMEMDRSTDSTNSVLFVLNNQRLANSIMGIKLGLFSI